MSNEVDGNYRWKGRIGGVFKGVGTYEKMLSGFQYNLLYLVLLLYLLKYSSFL